VRAASPLSDAQRGRLERALARRVGGEVELRIEVDASLIGGLVAKVGDVVYDGSLLTQLHSLRSNLS
jgi:F-type H+-transporting ATPase subunit delta